MIVSQRGLLRLIITFFVFTINRLIICNIELGRELGREASLNHLHLLVRSCAARIRLTVVGVEKVHPPEALPSIITTIPKSNTLISYNNCTIGLDLLG